MDKQRNAPAKRDINLVIDGNNIAIRSHFKMPHLTNKTGIHTGAIHGFLMSLLRLKKMYNPRRIVIAWDGGRAAWRNKMTPSYKANRDQGQRDQVYAQFGRLREILNCMPITNCFLEGVEADDIIGKFILEHAKDDYNLIISNDEDFFQLVNSHCEVANSHGEITRLHDFMEKHSCSPDMYLIIKSLVGDSSDNLPGLPGIGPKKARIIANDIMQGCTDPIEYISLEAAVSFANHKDKAIKAITKKTMDEIFIRNYRMMDLRMGARLLQWISFSPNPAFLRGRLEELLKVYELNEALSRLEEFSFQ